MKTDKFRWSDSEVRTIENVVLEDKCHYNKRFFRSGTGSWVLSG